MKWLTALITILEQLLRRRPPPGPEPPRTPGISDEELLVVFGMNAERERSSRPMLTVNDQLLAAAQAHARDMAREGFAHHDGADGSTFIDRARAAGYRGRVITEIVAAGQTSPGQVVNDWMLSHGHRASIMDPQSLECGPGHAVDAKGRHYWAVTFGRSNS